MKVLVFDVPASEGGALVVLRDFHTYASGEACRDIEWVFVVSTEALDGATEFGNVTIERYPVVKNGWGRRIRFEFLEAPSIIRRHKPDVIFSLQNTALLRTRIPQIVYVHQSLPYATRRFSYRKPEERRLALIADVFRPLIGWSVRHSVATVVQTEWIKEAICRKHRIDFDKIHVATQEVHFRARKRIAGSLPLGFFYPAAAFPHKAIEEIIAALAILADKGSRPDVYLTFSTEDNAYAARMGAAIHAAGLQANVHLLGKIPRERVLDLLRENVLVFTSKIESFGLPLLEARLLGAPIVVVDQPYSREVLAGYDAAVFVPQGDALALAAAIGSQPLYTGETQKKLDEVGEEVEFMTTGGWAEVLALIRGVKA